VEERLHKLGDPIGNGLVAVVLVDQDVNDEEGGVESRSMLGVAADHLEKNGRDNHTLENYRTSQFHINEELMEMLLKSNPEVEHKDGRNKNKISHKKKYK